MDDVSPSHDDLLSAAGLQAERLPRHVAIIMDGNGRWAARRGLERAAGHQAGAAVVESVTKAAVELGIEWLTLYAFSTENWRRPQGEVTALIALLDDYLDQQLATMDRYGVRLRAIGRLDHLPEGTRNRLHQAATATRDQQRMTLSLALSYGGRDEIVDAARALAAAVAAGTLRPEDIDHQRFAAHLYAPDAPDVDLLIRTAGEQRLSNFLMWQTHYAEYVSSPPYWPDFTREHLLDALRTYQGRERRFGSLTPAASME